MPTGQVTREWRESVNGTELRIAEAGVGGQAVVFSPALFTNRELFGPMMAALSADRRCICYDHRGQGDSGLGAPQPSVDMLGVEGLYDDAVALLDTLGVDSCHWVGSCMGGFVGMRLAARRPERVRSLVLAGVSIEPASRLGMLFIDLFGWMLRTSTLLGPIGARLRARLVEWSMTNMLGPTFMTDPARAEDREMWRQRWDAQMIPQALPMMRQMFGHPGNPPEMLAQIQAPTLVVVGEEEVGGDAEARAVQQAIPNARLVTIPRAGHAVFAEQPDAGTAAVTQFIREVEAP